MSMKEWLVTQKFRWDIAISFMTFINLILLSITASGYIHVFLGQIGLEVSQKIIIIVLVIASPICTFMFGVLLDKGFGFMQEMNSVQNKRNPQISKILSDIEQIKKVLEENNGRI